MKNSAKAHPYPEELTLQDIVTQLKKYEVIVGIERPCFYSFKSPCEEEQPQAPANGKEQQPSEADKGVGLWTESSVESVEMRGLSDALFHSVDYIADVIQVLESDPATRDEEHLDQLVHLLDGTKLLSRLPRRVQRAMCRVATLASCSAGQPLFPHAEFSDCFYLVLSGKIETEQDFHLGPQLVCEGEGYGEISLARETPRTAKARGVAEHTQLLCLSRMDYDLTLKSARAEQVIDILEKSAEERSEEELEYLERILLRQIDFFSSFHSKVIRSICRALTVDFHPNAGRLIYAKNDPAECLYVTITAKVEIGTSDMSELKTIRRRKSTQVIENAIDEVLRKNTSTSDARKSAYSPPPIEPRLSGKSLRSSMDSAVPIERKSSVVFVRRSSSLSFADGDPSGTDGSGNRRTLMEQQSLTRLPSVKKIVAYSASKRSIDGDPPPPQEHASVINVLKPGSVFGEKCLSKEHRLTGARLKQPGFIAKLDRSAIFKILHQWFEEETAQKNLLLDAALELKDPQSKDWMNKLAGVFRMKAFNTGDVLGAQGNQVEEIFLIDSGSCSVHMDLRMQRVNQPSRRRREQSQNQFSVPQQGVKREISVTQVGKLEFIGLGEVWHGSGKLSSTYTAAEPVIVMHGLRSKIMPLIESRGQVLEELKDSIKMKWKSRSVRIMQNVAMLEAQGLVPILLEQQALAMLAFTSDSKVNPDVVSPRRKNKKPPLLPVLDPAHSRSEPTQNMLRFNLAEVTSIVVNSKRDKKDKMGSRQTWTRSGNAPYTPANNVPVWLSPRGKLNLATPRKGTSNPPVVLDSSMAIFAPVHRLTPIRALKVDEAEAFKIELIESLTDRGPQHTDVVPQDLKYFSAPLSARRAA